MYIGAYYQEKNNIGACPEPLKLHMVKKSDLTTIGGIMTANDALEFLIAGAVAVQVGTANFINPHATTDIIDGIESFLIERNISNISDIIATLKA